MSNLPHTWAVANQKGGVGKTTTAVALGGLLARQGDRTLLVDMDPHASMSAYLQCEAGPAGGSWALFAEDRQVWQTEICQTAIENLELLPAVSALATVDRQFGSVPGMGRRLADALQLLGDRYQRVIVDCPPTLGVPMVNALAACERVVSPTQTEFMALRGLQHMQATLAKISHSLGGISAWHVVATLYDPRTHASTVCLQTLREQYAEHLANSVIPMDTQLREASHAGLPPHAWPGARRAARAYDNLLDELLAAETQSQAEQPV